MDSNGDLVADPLRDGEELDDIAELLRKPDVVGADGQDALAVDVTGRHPKIERDRRQDRGLGSRVVALEVGARVGFGVSEALGVGERLSQRPPVLGHASQDVVRRPVHDAHEPQDAVAGEVLAERPDQGDAATHRGLVQEIHAPGSRRFEQLS